MTSRSLARGQGRCCRQRSSKDTSRPSQTTLRSGSSAQRDSCLIRSQCALVEFKRFHKSIRSSFGFSHLAFFANKNEKLSRSAGNRLSNGIIMACATSRESYTPTTMMITRRMIWPINGRRCLSRSTVSSTSIAISSSWRCIEVTRKSTLERSVMKNPVLKW